MNIFFGILVGLVVLFALFMLASWIKSLIPSPMFEPVVYTPQKPDYWPTDGFRTSSPEQQGMDSRRLVQLYDRCQKAHAKNPDYAVDSVSIYRSGYQVAEMCFNPFYRTEDMHVVHSVTKSIISALIGIAIDQGYIDSVEVPFVDFFKDRQSAIKDDRMRTVRIKDLLSMQTGIRSRDYAIYRWEGLFEMQAQEDWVSFIMGLPLDAEPGTRFDYSNMSSYLLSAIIQSAAGMDTLTFARKNLFDPLGIQEIHWEQCPQGIWIGFARMWLKPADMARIGLLYQQKGEWDGMQIISQEWITESLTPHAFPKNLVDVVDANGEKDQKLTTLQWRGANFVRPFCDGYGYQWWLDKDGSYSAVGVSGQYIMVVPHRELVVVVTSASHGLGVFFPRKLLDRYILPAIRADGPIEEHPQALQQLKTYAQPPALAEQVFQLLPLPEMAKRISYQTYALEKNRWNYDNFKLIFKEGEKQACFSFTWRLGQAVEIQVGLDGTYQFTETPIGRFAAKGTWTAADKFEIEYQHIGYSAPGKFMLTFNGSDLLVEEFGLTGTLNYSGKARG